MWFRCGVICICLTIFVSAVAIAACTAVSNIALGKPVTVTVTGNDGTLAYEGESLADINDGRIDYSDPSLRLKDGCVGWRDSRSGGTMTVKVVVNLQATYNVNSIRFHTGATAHADTWSPDSMTTYFGTTSVNAGQPGIGALTTQTGLVTTSTVTLTFTKTNSGTNRDWMYIGEIEIYGSPLVGQPTSVLLPVAFMQQFFSTASCPDGGHGSCGPTSLSMCADYILGRTPTPQDIINVWAYLIAHGRSGADPCGNDSSGTSLTELTNAAHGVFGLSNVSQTTFTLAQLKTEIAAGRPVVVHVTCSYLSNRGYSYTGGHYIAAIGYDANNIICNDPATYLGSQKYYSNSDMTAAMSASGNGVLRNFKN